MAKKVSFGAYAFSTQKAAISECRNRINAYSVGAMLSDADQDFFECLFTLHTEYEEKVGGGVGSIAVNKDNFGGRMLKIHRIDGSQEEISWRWCIQQSGQDDFLYNAMRREVKAQIIEFKKALIDEHKMCLECGDIIESFNHINVVYGTPSFKELVADFCLQQGIETADVQYAEPSTDDNDRRGIVTDRNLAELWSAFHKYHCALEYKCKIEDRKDNP